MLKINHEQPVIIDRHEGYLHMSEATHHYCTVGVTPDGTILANYGVHPDGHFPPGRHVPVEVPGAKYPVYKFRPRQNYPHYRWPYSGCHCRSVEGGRAWSDPVPGVLCSGAAPVGDKTLCPFGEPGYVFPVEPGLGVTSMGESADNGRTWRDRPDVMFHYPLHLSLSLFENWIEGVEILGSFENCGTFKAMSDGSLMTFLTVGMDRDRKDTPWILPLMFRSTDGGYNFHFVGMPTGIPPPPESEATRGVNAFVEPALTELPNGDLLAVFRTGYHQPDRLMLQCKSSDGGKSWSDLITCPGVLRYYPVRRLDPLRNEGKLYSSNAGVSPWLTTLPNGVVAMTYGRPGLHITFSEDGTGDEWLDRIPIVPEPSLFGINYGNTGMSGVLEIGENELIVIYDIANYEPPEGGPMGNTVFSLRMQVERMDQVN